MQSDRVSIYSSINKAKAIELGQRTAFHVDASRIARLPLIPDYFPELSRNPLSAKARDASFDKVEDRMRELIAAGFEITRIDAV